MERDRDWELELVIYLKLFECTVSLSHLGTTKLLWHIKTNYTPNFSSNMQAERNLINLLYVRAILSQNEATIKASQKP